ncbi:MAG TPA: hypothetical protein VHB99_11120, partial [Pirellulales bacterium]|nr:hypothetical protein [Pirellulales bacterium]
MKRFIIGAIFAAILVSAGFPAHAEPVKKIAEALRHVYRCAFGKKPPHSHSRLDVEELAKEIDWLEHLIESYGSIVPKQPDVWGEERLTKHRHEYEREIAKRFNSDTFDAGLQAAVRRSDQSMLALALSINAAAQGGQLPAADSTNPAVTLITPTAGVPTNIVKPTELQQLDFTHFKSGEISLEP